MTAGMAGIRKKKIITMPCSVKSLLYVSDVNMSPSGVRSSRRMRNAKMPPTTKKMVTENR